MASSNLSTINYDAQTDILHVTHPDGVNLETAEHICAYFADVQVQWRKLTGGRKVYFIVDWSNVSTNMLENTAYTECVRQVLDEAALVIVRYRGAPLQRAAGRLAALKLHRPSHIYPSYAEAEHVIRRLRMGEVALAPR